MEINFKLLKTIKVNFNNYVNRYPYKSKLLPVKAITPLIISLCLELNVFMGTVFFQTCFAKYGLRFTDVHAKIL